MSKFRLKRSGALDAKRQVAREQVAIKALSTVYLFPYPGMGTAVAMQGKLPNRWWRMWHWILLGWRWNEQEAK